MWLILLTLLGGGRSRSDQYRSERDSVLMIFIGILLLLTPWGVWVMLRRMCSRTLATFTTAAVVVLTLMIAVAALPLAIALYMLIVFVIIVLTLINEREERRHGTPDER